MNERQRKAVRWSAWLYVGVGSASASVGLGALVAGARWVAIGAFLFALICFGMLPMLPLLLRLEVKTVQVYGRRSEAWSSRIALGVVLISGSMVSWLSVLWEMVVLDLLMAGTIIGLWWIRRRQPSAWRVLLVLILFPGSNVAIQMGLPGQMGQNIALVGFWTITLVVVLLYGRDKTWEWTRKGLCVWCGYDLTGQMERCPECGMPIAPRVKCSECGEVIYAHVSPCPKCFLERKQEARSAGDVWEAMRETAQASAPQS